MSLLPLLTEIAGQSGTNFRPWAIKSAPPVILNLVPTYDLVFLSDAVLAEHFLVQIHLGYIRFYIFN
jgi:hypothetical protein